MTQEKMTPLRERLLNDMRIHGMCDKAQKAHIRAVWDFVKFLGRSPDTAPSEAGELRVCGAKRTFPEAAARSALAHSVLDGMTRIGKAD